MFMSLPVCFSRILTREVDKTKSNGTDDHVDLSTSFFTRFCLQNQTTPWSDRGVLHDRQKDLILASSLFSSRVAGHDLSDYSTFIESVSGLQGLLCPCIRKHYSSLKKQPFKIWLLIDKFDNWTKGLEDWTGVFDRCLQTFLTVMR
jgi:hypothetical protein